MARLVGVMIMMMFELFIKVVILAMFDMVLDELAGKCQEKIAPCFTGTIQAHTGQTLPRISRDNSKDIKNHQFNCLAPKTCITGGNFP
jgi:hypothetical protein